MSNTNTSFGVGGVAIFARDGTLAGFSEVTGAFNADLSFPLIDVMGGPFRLPVDALQGRGEGGFTLTLNERPDWVDVIGNQAVLTLLDSAEAYSINNILGDTPNMVFADKAANDKAARGIYYIKVTGTAAVEVTLTNENGVRKYALADVKHDGTLTVGDTGLTIKKAEDKDWVAGNAFSVLVLSYSAAAPGKKLSYPSRGVRVPDYRLMVFSSGSGLSAGNLVRVLDLPHVKFAGTPFGMTDNEPNAGTELSGKILVPPDGGFFGIQYQIPVA